MHTRELLLVVLCLCMCVSHILFLVVCVGWSCISPYITALAYICQETINSAWTARRHKRPVTSFLSNTRTHSEPLNENNYSECFPFIIISQSSETSTVSVMTDDMMWHQQDRTGGDVPYSPLLMCVNAAFLCTFRTCKVSRVSLKALYK